MVRIGQRGTVVIPAQVRRELEIVEGGFVSMRVRDGSVVLTPIRDTSDAHYRIGGSRRETIRDLGEIGVWPNELSEVEYIPTNRVVARQGFDDAVVERYAEAMRRGESFPPIVVDEQRRIVDGHHRHEASLRVGYTEIPTRTAR